MRAIILAAGRGSRMKSLTDDKPKCLIERDGKTLLDSQIDSLKDAGISDIAIVTGYKRELLNKKNLLEFYNSRWSETNMVSSLECATELLASGDCIVAYSDIIYSPLAIRLLMVSKSDIAITYDKNWLKLWSGRFQNPLDDAETFRLGENSTLIEIGNKPQAVEQVQGQFMGLLRITPQGWKEIENIRRGLDAAERDKMHMTNTLQRIIDAGRMKIEAIPYSDFWREFDSESDLLHDSGTKIS